MDRNTVLAIFLCFSIYVGWQKYYIEPRIQHETALQTQLTTPPAPASSTAGNQAAIQSNATANVAVTSAKKTAPQTKTLSTETGTALLGDGNQAFVGWTLKGYKLGIAPEAAAVDLKSVTNQPGEVELAFDDSTFANMSEAQGTLTTTPQGGVVWNYEDSNIKVSRDVTPADQQPYLNLTYDIQFKNRRPNYAFVSLTAQHVADDPEEIDRQLLYWTEKSLERVQVKDGLDQLKDIVTPVRYIGATNRYFLMTLVAQGGLEPKAQIQPIAPGQGRISMVFPITSNQLTLPFKAYFGPKELETLRRVDPALDNAVDLGWFQIFAYPMLKLLKFLNAFVHNYGVAIILLTLLLKIVTYPLTYKSMKSMKEMASLQPQLQKIREKYKDDKQKLNTEMLSLMKTHGYNPAAGCVPMLIQMPIFIALYRVLYSSIELFHAPFALWIHDLSTHDPYYVTPILLAGTMYLQQKLTPQTTMDPAQQKMMQFMPLIFGAMMMNLPSGLTIYMLTNALASIVQQIILNKKFDVKAVSGTVVKA